MADRLAIKATAMITPTTIKVILPSCSAGVVSFTVKKEVILIKF